MKLGIVGGAGWLGGAIARALLGAGVLRAENLSLSSRRPPASDACPGAFWTGDNQLLADRSDVVILSVRPGDWPSVAVDARGKLVVSVMAGIRLDAIRERHGARCVVRALPNAAAEVGKSYTPWIAGEGATDRDRALVRSIFGACGVEDEVESERDIDYMTGLTGSGPAFPALLAAAMTEHAVAFGLAPEVAQRAVTATMAGAGRLMEAGETPPGSVVDAFLDYRGTTAAALQAMRDAGFDRAVAQGLEAAFEKSLRMGAS